MTPSELARMRNPLSIANVRRISRTLRAIDYNLTVRCRNMVEFKDWQREISDDLCACLAILNEWDRRRKEVRNEQ